MSKESTTFAAISSRAAVSNSSRGSVLVWNGRVSERDGRGIAGIRFEVVHDWKVVIA